MPSFPADFHCIDQVWLPVGDHLIAYSDGAAVEQRLAEILDRTGDLSSLSPELAAAICDWPTEYHFSAERASLCRPLALTRAHRVLELGAGCGAVTRYLAETAGHVTALEGSAARARLARQRCRDLDNVTVIAANFEAVDFPEQFDVVTLIGVLEYAPIYVRHADPFLAALALAYKHLKPGGALVVAIENRLGLKYFAGCSEDHLAQQFVGIEGYPDPDNARTFSRQELAALLEQAGFTPQGLLLPFPDYKLPSVLINAAYCDATTALRYNLADWAAGTFRDYSRPRDLLFADQLALAGAASAGLFAEFANSFCAVVVKPGAEPLQLLEPRAVAVKYNVGRQPGLRTETALLVDAGQEVVVKGLLDPPRAPGRLALIPSAAAQFVPSAESLTLRLLRAVRRGGPAGLDQFQQLVADWHAYLLGFVDPAGVLPADFFDCTPTNLLVDPHGGWHYIDAEWQARFTVDLPLVMVRGLLNFWLACRHWLEHDLLPDPYTLGDYLALALAKTGLSIDPAALVSYAAVEDAIQAEVSQRPAGSRRELVGAEHPHTGLAASPAGLRRVLGRVEAERDRLGHDCHELKLAVAGLQRCADPHNVGPKLADRIQAIAGRHAGTGRGAAPLEPARHDYAILVPIYNAIEHVERCLASLVAHTEPRHQLLLLDDASPDPAIAPLLASYAARHPQIRVITAPANGGFIANCNRGFAATPRDVVILNSDTQVTAGWLDRLDRCRQSDPALAIVSPLSNNATILSVPRMNRPNQLPDGMTVDEFAALVAGRSERVYPRLPVAVGFCMLITRACLTAVGDFDPVFGAGYGEECDFCLRAWQAGFEVGCADDAYVHHYGEASFGSSAAMDERRRANQELLVQRWPDYNGIVTSYCRTNPLRRLQESLEQALAENGADQRLRVLHVIHNFGAAAGTELHTLTMIRELAGICRATVAFPCETPEWTDIDLRDAAPYLRVAAFNQASFASPETVVGMPSRLLNDLAESSFHKFVAGGAFDVIHFQHLLNWTSLALPVIAKQAGAKVVLSLHDYFLMCPEYNLLLPDLTRCGRASADPADAGCQACLAHNRELLAPGGFSTTAYLEVRRQLCRSAIAAADLIVCPSSCVAELAVRAFGALVDGKLCIIPHGVAAPAPSPRPAPQGQLRIGFLGNVTERKGAATLLQVAQALQAEPFAFTVFGGVAPALAAQLAAAGIKLAGSYRTEELPELLAQVDLVLIPSIWDETFCLTLSEAQAMGVPVVAAAVGAIAERIEPGVTGFTYPAGDSQALATLLRGLHADRRPLAAVAARLANQTHKTVAANAADYARLYLELTGRRLASDDYLRDLLGRPHRQPATDPAISLLLPAGSPAWTAPAARRHQVQYLLDQASRAWDAGNPTAALAAWTAAEQAGAQELAVRIGDCLLATGDSAAAAGRYRAALEQAPASAAPHIGLGVVALLATDHTAAHAAFAAACAAEPGSTRAATGLAMACLGLGDPVAAGVAAARSLDLDPDQPQALALLIQAAYATNTYPAAIAALRAYLQHHPADLDHLFALAGLLVQAGDPAGARGQLELLELFAPDYPGLTELKAHTAAAACSLKGCGP